MLAKQLNNLRLGLSQKYLLGVLSGLIATVLAFVALSSLMYQEQLLESQTRSSQQIGQLLLASLQQPLITRDKPGMTHLIDRLAEQPGISNVMLANAHGSIRFSSIASMRNTNPLTRGSEGCTVCHDLPPSQRPNSTFIRDELGQDVLRSITPIPTGPECVGCHADDPNGAHLGMLVVDFNAQQLRRSALNNTVLLMGAGALVLSITLLGGWWFMQKVVLAPIWGLRKASMAWAQGQLACRVTTQGHDELAHLGEAFNTMAGNLQNAMHQLHEHQAFQQALIDAIPDGIRVIDDQYRVIAANTAYCRQLGLPLEKVVDHPCHQSSHCRAEPCIPTLVTCPVHEFRENPQAIKFLDTHCRADGGAIEVEVSAAPLELTSQTQGQRFVVEAIRDLNQQVQYSQEQKISDLGQLAAGVAHEIRNPLTSLQMAFSYIKRGELSEAAQDEYLDLASREIQRCIGVSDRLLKLSALPSAHAELVDVNNCVAETLSLLNYEAERRELKLQLQLQDQPVRVLASDSEIRMIVLNLVQNAFHALPSGGIIAVTVQEQGEQNERVQLLIEDNGQGIDPRDAKRIFDPFFSRRLDGSNGSGLGLAIVKSLVTRHQGQISVEPSNMGGACFRIEFANANKPTEELE